MCKTRYTWFGKVFEAHCYEAVYNSEEIETMPPEYRLKDSNGNMEALIKAIKNSTKRKTYVKHVCRYCGHQIKE